MSGSTYGNTGQTVRRPRYALLANGIDILDSTKISVSSQNNFHADRCSATIMTNKDSQYGPEWWGSQDTITIEVKVGMLQSGEPENQDSSGWTSIFKGRVDHIDWHGPTGIIQIEGRDRSAELMDAKTAETFANKTSSEIAETLAQRHGLQTDVESTSTIVGVYYAQEHDKISLNSFHKETTEWALLVYLAQQEGFDVWVTGDTLHFKPPQDQTSAPYLVQRSTDNGNEVWNVIDPRCSRDCTKSKDIKVVVKSWNHKQKTAHTYTAGGGSSGKTGGKKGGGSVGQSAQTYVYVIPGLSAAQAQKEANRRLEILTKLERVISFREPGNLDYDVRTNVVVQGTNSTWDTTYWIDELTRSLSFEEGFVQHVRAKNHSTRSQANVG